MTQLGKQPARYRFLLNPYQDVRFTVCPCCRAKTRVRKAPLVVHVDPTNALVLNKTCRYCAGCDLLIVHQDELEDQLTIFFANHAPQVVGNDYLVLGTLDRPAWQRGRHTALTIQEMLDNVHDFKEVLRFEVHQGWLPTE